METAIKNVFCIRLIINLVFIAVTTLVTVGACWSRPTRDIGTKSANASTYYHDIHGAKTDCGAVKYAATLSITHALIRKEAEMPHFISELANMAGPFCNRIVFEIDAKGKAKNIHFAERSPSLALDSASLKAIRGYLFFLPTYKEENKFMLIFHSPLLK